MSKKNPVVLLVSAIIAFVLAVGGLWYSFTDNAIIVGKWSQIKDVNEDDSSSSSTSTNSVEFTIDGRLIAKSTNQYHDSYYDSSSYSEYTTNATYALDTEDHTMIQGSGTHTTVRRSSQYSTDNETETSTAFPDTSKYYFVNGNKELVFSDGGLGLSRTDAIPFYVLVQVLSILFAIAGGIFLKNYLKQKKSPAAPAPYTPGYGAPVAPAPYTPGYGAPGAPATPGTPIA